jgi:hypothetical protein
VLKKERKKKRKKNNVTVFTTGFNIHKFYVLPTQCICVDLRTYSDYFSIQQ